MSLVCNQQYHAFESCSFRGSCVVITLKLLQQVQSKIVKQMKQVKQVKSAFETSLMRLGIIEVDRRCLASSQSKRSDSLFSLHALSRDALAIQSTYHTQHLSYFPSAILVALLLQLFPHS